AVAWTWGNLVLPLRINGVAHLEEQESLHILGYYLDGSRNCKGNTWAHLFTNEAVAFGDSSGFVGEAELWESLDGLLVLLNKGFKRVTIQSDNMEVVRALQESWWTNSSITVLRRIRRILKVEGQWCI
ncbi:hypothetical protein Gogos_010260, partial [Gossypium gossypioides]|nr:hypothetical protein [Gossypium gossypioides]